MICAEHGTTDGSLVRHLQRLKRYRYSQWTEMTTQRGEKTMAHQDTVIAWLNDAHALELNLAQVLEHRVNDTKDHPHIQARIQQHLDQTRRHAELVKGCVERLGGNTSAVKSAMGQI